MILYEVKMSDSLAVMYRLIGTRGNHPTPIDRFRSIDFVQGPLSSRGKYELAQANIPGLDYFMYI